MDEKAAPEVGKDVSGDGKGAATHLYLRGVVIPSVPTIDSPTGASARRKGASKSGTARSAGEDQSGRKPGNQSGRGGVHRAEKFRARESGGAAR